MNLRRWLHKIDEFALTGVSELEMFGDARTRDEMLARLEKHQQTRPRQWRSRVTWAFMLLFTLLFGMFGGPWLKQLSIARQFLFFACFAVLALFVRFVGVLIARQQTRLFFRAALLARDIPICFGCGYDLRGTVSERCSECGRELDARVREILAAQGKPELTPMQK